MDKGVDGPSSFTTVARKGEGRLTEKMSRFLAFALPVDDAESAKAAIKTFSNSYHDARHVCWAYMIGAKREEYLSSDNGEPSGTAGRPILGQINSLGLTNVLVVVVRYFGGIKLGTPGLIAAYREAARMALEDAGVKEVERTKEVVVNSNYENLHRLMKFIKDNDIKIKSQVLEDKCVLTLDVKLSGLEDFEKFYTSFKRNAKI